MMRNSLVRSILTSIFSTAVDFGTLMGLVELFDVHYVLATFLGTLTGFVANFLINRHWAFEATKGKLHWQVVRAVPVQAGSTGLQTLGVWVFDSFLGLRYWSAKIVVATLVYMCWNYPMNRFWVFRTKVGGNGGAPKARRKAA
jgi:putative flippase GtrA